MPKVSEFDRRLAPRLAELQALFSQLYSDDAPFTRLLEAVKQAYRVRPVTLKELDRQRETNPDWYKGNDLMGMCLYVKQFAGDLKGVRERLDYLQEAGINYLHLMPLLDTVEGRSDGGYAVADFRKVLPELGTMGDLSRLTEACHERGMICCLDFVMNHTSEDHKWARMARAGEREYQDYYFFFDDWDVPNEYEKLVPQVFPTTAPGSFTYLEDMGKIVMTSFYPYQWDLNYRNPAVFIAMTQNLLFLANRGLDVIRIDAVPYIWKELGTDCRNLPQVHTIVRMLRLICEIACPGTLLLGEVVMAPEKLAPYFGSVEHPECHMLYNATTMCSTWHTVATRDTRLLRHQINAMAALPKDYVFLNYLRCHDDIGWGLDFPFLQQFGMEEVPHKAYLNAFFTGEFPGSFSRGERYNDAPELGDARLCGTTASLTGVETAEESGDSGALDRAIRLDLMLHAYMMSLSGLPMLYSGDEIGQLNDYAYHDDPRKAEDSRYLHRGDFRWEKAALRRDTATSQGRLFTGILRLEEIRRGCAVFDSRAQIQTFAPGDDALLGIKRYWDGLTLTAAYNFSEYPMHAGLDAFGPHTELVEGRDVDLIGEWELPPYGFVWLLSSR